MDQFDPDSITPEKLSLYRQAAESAWGDDTRHPNFVGHPKPSAGQCYVTSAWLQSKWGGHVGGKAGHFFWVSPTRSHIVDLTGDHEHGESEIPTNPIHVQPTAQGISSGPVHYERADHPHWKGFRVVPESKNPRVRIFSQRANAALNGQKLADGAMGSDPYPGETPEKIDQMNQLNFHDEPNYEPDSTPTQYNFVWARGQLHVSPQHSHAQLLGHAGADPDSEGPTAVGYADVAQGHVTWRVESNVGLQALRDVLADYSRHAGWKFDGLVGTDGQPMGLDLGPIMSFWYRTDGDNVQIAKSPIRGGKRIEVTGSTAWVKDASHPGLVDWAGDLGLALRETSQYNQWNENHAKAKGVQSFPGSLRSREPQKLAQGDEEAQVAPEFPSLPEATEIHDQSIADFGQPYAPLLNPGGLESAMGRAANYWHYGEGSPGERVADAAGALAHGMGAAQAFEDGNKRAAFHTTRYFLHNNGYGHLSPVDHDDEELADHLVGHGEGTHSLEDTQRMFRSRLPRLASYPGGGNMLDQMRHREDLEMFNNGDPDFQPERQNLDEEPGGPFVCKQCGAKPQSFGEYKTHMADHERMTELPIEDGKFPPVQDFDEPLGFGTNPKGNSNMVASVQPFVMVTTQHEASRVPEFQLYRDLFGFGDNCTYYGAYRNGEMLGYGVVKEGFEPEVLMVQSSVHGQGVGTAIMERIKLHHDHFYSHSDTDAGAALMRKSGMVNTKGQLWRYAAGNEPKDMIEADVPFVYDIPHDKLILGYAGNSTHDVRAPGGFSAGGVVEGYYQPGGKIIIQTASTWAFSVRHLCDLWYHTAPQMEITSVEMVEQDGSNTKLAGREGWFAPSYGVPDPVRQQISDWVSQQAWPEGTKFQSPDKYHITSFYSPEGYQDPANHEWLAQHTDQGFPAVTHSLDSFASPDPNSGAKPVVMRFHAPELSAHAEQLMNEAEARGLQPARFDGGHKPHITVAHSTALPDAVPPAIQFQTEPLHELHGYYDSLKQRTSNQEVGQYIRTLLQSDVAAEKAYRALRDAGGKVYAVGGAPRDALQGKIPNDIDLMVAGLPSPEVEHILSKLPGNVTFAGKNFGVFHYHVGGDTVEIALPRSDDYNDGRRSDATITVDHELPIADDLKRRDFTANATAVDLDTGELIDPHGGAQDIKRGVLRTTHPNSFREDPSRLIRALTMHGRFNLTPDEQTRHEMESNAHLLRGESPDLLNKVFTKTMGSDNPASAIRLAHDTGLLKHILPEVHDNFDFDQNNPHHSYSLGEHLLNVLDNTSRLTTDPDVRMAALLHDIGKPASAWVNPQTGSNHYYQGPEGQGANHEDVGAQMAEDRLRGTFNLQTARINRIRHLIKNHMFQPFTSPKGARKFLAKVGDDHADDLLNLREADQTGKGQTPEEVAARTSADSMRGLVEQARVQGAPTDVSGISVNGNDLIAMGLKPGPGVGTVLRQLTNDVISDPMLNDRQRLMERAESYVRAQPES